MIDDKILFNPRFNYCTGNIKNAKVQGAVSCAVWLTRIREPRSWMVDLIAKIRTERDESVKANLKTKLPSVTPAVQFARGDARAYKNIKTFTGIMMMDFDKIEEAPDFRDYLFEEYPYIFATWLSSSGRGVRAMVRVPESKTTDEFKSRFKALRKVFLQYNGFDSAPQNSVLPLFYSIDAEIKFNLFRSEIFNDIHVEPVRENKPVEWVKPSDVKSKWAIDNVKKAINKITDNGHPQLRAAAYCLGGYVGAGYLGEGEAIGLIEALIDANTYLSIKPDVYKQTAKTMIIKGQREPLTL